MCEALRGRGPATRQESRPRRYSAQKNENRAAASWQQPGRRLGETRSWLQSVLRESCIDHETPTHVLVFFGQYIGFGPTTRVITLQLGKGRDPSSGGATDRGLSRVFKECIIAALPSSAGGTRRRTPSKNIVATCRPRWPRRDFRWR